MKNIWRFVAKILVVCMTVTTIGVTPIPARAENEESTIEDVAGVPEDWEYSINDNGGVSITGYLGKDKKLRIPDTLEGYPVTQIGDCFMESKKGVTQVVLSKYLKRIGHRAFAYCTTLSGNLVIPEGVTMIGEGAFVECGFKGSLTLPSTLKSIGNNGFSNCKFQGALILPDSLRTIGAGAFSYCEFSGEITIPDTIQKIGDYAFVHCLGLTEVYMPNKNFEIGTSVFLYDTITIYGTPGSTAEECAKREKFPFVDIETLNTTSTPEPTPDKVETDEKESSSVAVEKPLLMLTPDLSVKLTKNKSDYPKFSWKKNANATFYEVYRSTKRSNGYRRMKELSYEKTSYTDKNGKLGKCYYYKVRTVYEKDGKKQYGNFSNILKIKCQYLTTPIMQVKKNGGSAPEIVVTLLKKQGKFVQIYYQKEAGKKKRIRLRSEKLKKVYRIKYRSPQEHLTIWLRTYTKKGGKVYYSRYAKRKF